MSTPIKRKIANLDVWEVPGEEGRPAVVLFHGFGANAQDLLPLHTVLKAPRGTTWYFPEGPVVLGEMMGVASRAWFNIDQQAVERAIAQGTFRDLSGLRPPGLDEACEQARDMLAELDVPFSEITLGGFSQGSMLAVDLTLQSPESPGGLVILSGTLVDEANCKKWAVAHKRLQFFQSHGSNDQMLGFNEAKRLEAMLREAGLAGEFVGFAGGHDIPQGVIARLSQYLLR